MKTRCVRIRKNDTHALKAPEQNSGEEGLDGRI
jgi:hypothetical protein